MRFLNRVIDSVDAYLERYFAKKWHWIFTAAIVLAILFILYFAFCFTSERYVSDGFASSGHRTAFFVLFGIHNFICLSYLFLEFLFKRLTGRKAVWAFMLIASSCLIAWGFTNPLNLGHHHDSGALGKGNHWSIIYDIFSTGQVPPVNLHNQYYQPKFYHLIIAYLMKFNSLFIHVGDTALSSSFPDYTLSAYHALELTRVYMIILGISSFYATYKSFFAFGISDKKAALATIFAIMIPQFWYVQFFFNNDGQAFAFALIALALAFRFKNNEKILPLSLSALFLGMAMMSKLNAVMMAIPIAIIFIYVLFRKISAKDKVALWRLVGKFAVFAAIVFPVGLWTPIYYNLKYDMPVGYVLDLCPTQEAKDKYGMYIDPNYYNFFQRYILVPAGDLFSNVFNLRWRSKVNGVYVNNMGDLDYNAWTAFFKTAFFDEWNDFNKTIGGFATAILTVCMYLYVFLSLFAFLYGIARLFLFFKKKEFKKGWFLQVFITISELAFILNYIIFIEKYPVGCSQNCRYVMPLFLTISYLNGSFLVDAFSKIREIRKRPDGGHYDEESRALN